VEPCFHLALDEEKKRYDRHQNSPGDPGYREFLNKLFLPLKERLEPGARGLDFGSGPGPTLSVMFEEAGYPTELFDPFYANRRKVLNAQYDFITVSEVIEHLRNPKESLDLLWSCLKNKGWLGIMTATVPETGNFSKWYYIHDPTHIGFYSEKTFTWIARHWNAHLERIAPDVALLQKN